MHDGDVVVGFGPWSYLFDLVAVGQFCRSLSFGAKIAALLGFLG